MTQWAHVRLFHNSKSNGETLVSIWTVPHPLGCAYIIMTLKNQNSEWHVQYVEKVIDVSNTNHCRNTFLQKFIWQI